MRKTYCDVCGKEIGDPVRCGSGWKNLTYYVEFKTNRDQGSIKPIFDLCETCIQDVWKTVRKKS